MDESIWLQYFLRRREEFYNPETVRRLLSLLAGDSFRLIADANEPAYEVWLDVSLDKSPDEATLQKEDASITTVFTAGISSALLLKVERYIHKQDPLLSFHAYSVTREGPLARVEFGGSIEPEEGLHLSGPTKRLEQKGRPERNFGWGCCKRFIDAGIHSMHMSLIIVLQCCNRSKRISVPSIRLQSMNTISLDRSSSPNSDASGS